jgi:hypothetical protein
VSVDPLICFRRAAGSRVTLNGRNFVQLTTLVPGAADGESFDSKNEGLFARVDISFSGSPSVDNQWTADGAGNSDIGSQRHSDLSLH